MSLTDQLLATISAYGLPALFAVIAIAAVGVPLPVTLALVAAGSFVELGEMRLWQVIIVGTSAAILGDQIGFVIGRWGGSRIETCLQRTKSGADKFARARAFAEKWGGTGIFLSRWLVTPLGPWLNLTSGMTDYPWRRFFVWDALGETLWVVLYVGLLWTIYINAEMSLMAQAVAIQDLESEHVTRSDIAQLTDDAERLISDGREATGLNRFTAAPIECTITRVDVFQSDSRRRVLAVGESGDLEIETSLERSEFTLDATAHQAGV